MKKTTFLFLSIFLVAPSPLLPGQTNDYFPLQVGNTWVFDLYEWPDVLVLQDTISIIDSLTIDSKTWFLFNRYFTIHELEDSVYLRAEEDKVYRYQAGREELWFDFTANEGDSWQISTRISAWDTLVPVTVKLQKKKYTHSVNNRTFENCFNFSFDFAVDNKWYYTIAPGAGCIDLSIAGTLLRRFSFRNGVINGIVYPDLVTSVGSNNKLEQDVINKQMLSIYPNPFNSSTRIVINAPKALGHTKPEVHIYDVNGRIIKKFSLSPENTTQIMWNGENDNGMIVPSGLYFVAIRFDREYVVKKVVFVR